MRCSGSKQSDAIPNKIIHEAFVSQPVFEPDSFLMDTDMEPNYSNETRDEQHDSGSKNAEAWLRSRVPCD